MERSKAEKPNLRELGTAGESLAAEYLRRRGVRLLERNYRTRRGEIDLIGRWGEYLVFFEVKYRRGSGGGSPEEAVGIGKQRQICRVADHYRCVRAVPLDTPVRYDVVAIDRDGIRWIQNAFPHRYG